MGWIEGRIRLQGVALAGPRGRRDRAGSAGPEPVRPQLPARADADLQLAALRLRRPGRGSSSSRPGSSAAAPTIFWWRCSKPAALSSRCCCCPGTDPRDLRQARHNRRSTISARRGADRAVAGLRRARCWRWAGGGSVRCCAGAAVLLLAVATLRRAAVAADHAGCSACRVGNLLIFDALLLADAAPALIYAAIAWLSRVPAGPAHDRAGPCRRLRLRLDHPRNPARLPRQGRAFRQQQRGGMVRSIRSPGSPSPAPGWRSASGPAQPTGCVRPGSSASASSSPRCFSPTWPN